MDPLSILSGSITLYAAVRKLKKFKASYSEAPKFVSELLNDCDHILTILLHAKSILTQLDSALENEDVFGPVDIRDELKENITHLQPDIEALQKQLAKLEDPPRTNYDLWRKRVRKFLLKSKLEESHKKIRKGLEGFKETRQSLDR
jgi:hypothetical protein